MRLLKSLIALSSIALSIIFIGCAHNRPLPARMIYNHNFPDWDNSDISLLPVSDNPKILAYFASKLSQRNVSHGQKRYAVRLAKYANEKDKKNINIAIILSRAAFIAADAEESEKKMEEYAEIGTSALENTGAIGNNPEMNYYYGLNLGLIVRAKGLFALGKLPKVVKALKIAKRNPNLDMGGPLRVLGMIYLRAPAWPQGIGDFDLALEHLEEASLKYPEQPQNHIFYARALIEDDDYKKAAEMLKLAKSMIAPEIWGVYYTKRWRAEIIKLEKKISD